MIYAVADIVSFLSHLMTLEPGDVICTGTPSGVGVATGNFLKAGDRIECTIENLGDADQHARRRARSSSTSRWPEECLDQVMNTHNASHALSR